MPLYLCPRSLFAGARFWLLNFAFFLWECSVTAACYASSGMLQTIILYSATRMILCKYIQETLVRIEKLMGSRLGTKTSTLLSLSNPTVYSFIFLLYQTYEVPSHLYVTYNPSISFSSLSPSHFFATSGIRVVSALLSNMSMGKPNTAGGGLVKIVICRESIDNSLCKRWVASSL